VPTIGTATAGGESASITFTPATKGGTASTYTALSNPGSVTGSGASSPVTVTGLTAGTAYTFTVRGNNSTGSSEYSSASNSIVPTESVSYESIATVTVNNTSTTQVEFTSIPSTYTHLQVRAIAKLGASSNGFDFRVNSDSTNGRYAIHSMMKEGSGRQAVSNTSLDKGRVYAIGEAFGGFILDFFDYANTNKLKTIRAWGGYDNNGSGSYVSLSSSLYNQTTAISSIQLFVPSSVYEQYSHFALYGIKGA
jgi:hypothetical protein